MDETKITATEAVEEAQEVDTRAAADAAAAPPPDEKASDEPSAGAEPQDAKEPEALEDQPVAEAPGKADPSMGDKQPITSDETAREVEGLKARLLQTSAQTIAARVGVLPERVNQAIRLAGDALAGIDVNQPDADAKIETALRGVLSDVPEFAANQDTGSAGGHKRTRAEGDLRQRTAEAMGVKL